MANKQVTLKRVIDTAGSTDNIYPTTDWDQVENKPSTFTPTSHTHPGTDIIIGGSPTTTPGTSDYIAIKNSSNNIHYANITFNQTHADTFLRRDGSWQTVTSGSTFNGGTITENLTISKTAPKIFMSDDVLVSGLASEVDGELVNYGTNYSQLGSRVASYPGSFFRIDVRDSAASEMFNVKYIPPNGSEQTVFKVSRTGDVVATGNLNVNATGRAATIGGVPTGAPNAVVATQTSYLELVAGAGGNTNSSGLIFHNPGVSTSVLEYVNTDANNAYFNFRSDDTGWELRSNGNRVWHAGNDGSGSGLEADTVDGVHAASLVPQTSFSDFVDGTLVRTDINYSQFSGDSFQLEIEGKSYGQIYPWLVRAQGYIYGDTIINQGIVDYTGNFNIEALRAFNLDGVLCFWWPRASYWNSFAVKVYQSTNAGIVTNRVLTIENSVIPAARTKEVGFNTLRLITSGSIGSQSVNYANSAGSAGSASDYANFLLSRDNRTIAPNNDSNFRVRFGFTAWNNNSTGPYADYLHLRSYSDGSGGKDNLVMFKKEGIGMRIWQQDFGSGTAYSNYSDVWHSQGTLQNGSIWINDGTNANNYNENIRLFAASNGVSVIGFNATGTGGTPVTSILGFSDNLETRVGNTWRTRIYSTGLEVNGGLRTYGATYNRFDTWTELPGFHGFYSSNNSAHIYPNPGSYGSWKIDGSRNGWAGIEFGAGPSGMSLMIGTGGFQSGIHNNSSGWQFLWEGGELKVGKGSSGGNLATVLDSSNRGSYASAVNSTSTESGGLKTRLSGTTLFMTSNGSNA
jgi:hypothetical protein